MRVRIELEPIKSNDCDLAAVLTYETKANGGSFGNFKPMNVYKDTKVVDFGFEPLHLAVNSRDTNTKGESTICIKYSQGTEPLKIKRVVVYTEKPLDGGLLASLVTGMKSPNSMDFICEIT